MPKRSDIKTILIIGAGPIVIGQACEFDYSGAQACKALRDEGYRVVLVNSNPATIMTDPGLADATYIEPITPEVVAKIIESRGTHFDPAMTDAFVACLPKILEQTMGINYGFEKVRFMSPVKTGKRIRGAFKLAEARFRGAGMLMNTYEVTVEIEDERKPALTANWITISQFDPKDRPEDV